MPAHAGAHAPAAHVPLTHEDITRALVSSDDQGETINLASWGFTEVGEDAGRDLAAVGKEHPDDDGIVTRIALNGNSLTDLPRSLELINRLRYLNLRANAFSAFPAVLMSLPRLEILDISRNAITELPPHPGTLTNLNVFSFAKNLITRLPVYLTEFEWLRVLKIESNPITWPPPDIWDRSNIESEAEQRPWLYELKAWLLVHADSEAGPDHDDIIKNSSDDEVLFARTHLARPNSGASTYAFQHERSYSTDSEISLTSFDSKPDALQPAFVPAIASSSSLNTLSIPKQPAPDAFESQSDSSSHAVHARGLSYSVETTAKASRRRTQMMGKKSMPNLRSSTRTELGNNQSSFSRPPPPQSSRTPPPPPLDTSIPEVPPIAGPSKIKPASPTRTPTKSTESSVPIDQERNHYFRRVSALPKPRAETPQKMPASLLKTVDAIRGILFSLSQIYSAVRDYTASAIDDRTSSVLIKVLEPASSYLSGLISALEQFDAASARGELPAPEICRTLITSCRDSVAVFGKVTGVLQLQLKVLASSHDPRYTRTLLLMLYGSMAEISNSWQAMLPLLPSLVPLLHSRKRAAPQQNGIRQRPQRHGISRSTEGSDAPPRILRLNSGGIKPLAVLGGQVPDKTPSPPSSNGAHAPEPIAYNKRTLAARARRQGGSFSSNDLEAGRRLPSRSPSESSYPASVSSPSIPSPVTSQRPLAVRTGSTTSVTHHPTASSLSKQYSPLQPPNLPFAPSSRSHSRGQSNSSSGSIPSPSLGNTSIPPSLAPLASTSGTGSNQSSLSINVNSTGLPGSPQLPSARSRSRAGDYPSPQSSTHHRPTHSTRNISTEAAMHPSVTTSRIVDADLLVAMETATRHATEVWRMLAGILRAAEADGQGRKADEQMWEALQRVEEVTVKMMAYFPEARDGDSEAGKKALGEDAHTFVKSTVQILVLLKSFATRHPLPHGFRETVTRLTTAMQDVTVFLHVSSYAPTPTPVPPSATIGPPGGFMGAVPSSQAARPYSPAIYTTGQIPMTPIVGNNAYSYQAPTPTTPSVYPTMGYNFTPAGDERSLGVGSAGTPTGLGRSRSATAGPAALKMTPNGFPEPPLTALPQNQSFRLG
ncbi:hypothetical protein DL93DRAFT_1449899 [Clavulina sp. PMI_390]|nr:hypothetical protein DL93DRAFT_1449899 [Clavulina sp. PMI_390]